MHCASCGYDLVGLPPGPCPECSHPFVPEDPTTWDPRPLPPWRKAILGRWSGYIAITLVGFLAMWHTILPRPYIAWNGTMNPSLWVWFDRPFGVERQPTRPETLELTWWDGTLTGVRFKRANVLAPHPKLEVAWDIRRRGDRWTLDVVQPEVRLDSVLLAYNSMRRDDELFGLQLDIPGMDPNAPVAARRAAGDVLNDAPFRVTGRQDDVLSAILVAYRLDVRPFLTSPDDQDVWVFNKDAGHLEEISVEEARERGYECEVVDSFSVRRRRFRQ